MIGRWQTASNHVLHRATSLSHDARYPEGVKVEYVFHPLHGQHVAVLRVDGNPYEPHLLIQTSEASQRLPRWMTDPDRCQQLTWGALPCCSLSALRELDRLLNWLDETPPRRRQRS